MLQPPPEVVALFDETILLSEGRIIYCGPTSDIIDHFGSLGYALPERMDVADWLQQLPTPDGAQFLADKSGAAKHLTSAEFKERFDTSEQGMKILQKLDSPETTIGPHLKSEATTRYKNSALASLRLLVGRELLLWWRDKPAIAAKIVQGEMLNTLSYFERYLMWKNADTT